MENRKSDTVKASPLQKIVIWLASAHERACGWPHIRVPYDPKHPFLSGFISGGFAIWLTTLIYSLIEAVAK